MSLNRYEQGLFSYVDSHPEEKRHWQQKITEMTRGLESPGSVARTLERDLWAYYVERSSQVPQIRSLGADASMRVSMLNLAEYMLRVWGPLPKPKKKPSAWPAS